MAGHNLIDAYLNTLAGRLPAAAVDELAGGLEDTYRHHLAQGLDAHQAIAAAVAEFGPPDVVVAAFVAQAPGRRAARALLCSGPFVGACWALALLTGRIWAESIPVAARAAFGATLLAAVVTLAVAATCHSYRLTQATAVPAAGLLLLDATMVVYMFHTAAWTWLPTLAVGASLIRIALTLRVMPCLLARRSTR